jgi:hypothetical protein
MKSKFYSFVCSECSKRTKPQWNGLDNVDNLLKYIASTGWIDTDQATVKIPVPILRRLYVELKNRVDK